MIEVLVIKAPMGLPPCRYCGKELQPRKPYILIEDSVFHEKCGELISRRLEKLMKQETLVEHPN